ncbi:MAG TPA: TonB-dependent receptor [Acidobacteriota bacterium]
MGQGSGSIAGQVTDPSGGAVAGALVTLYSRGSSTRIHSTTDSGGSYRVDRLAPGEYEVEAEAKDLGRSFPRNVIVERGITQTVNISLQLSLIREQVVVTASGSAQPVDEVSKAITVISRQEIESRDEFSIAEALRTVPGLHVQQLGGPGSFASIKTRGLRNEDTAVLIDGLRFRDAAAPQADASGYLEDLMATDLDRVEILRGSGSSLYGTNAIGGVINLVTDEGGGATRGGVALEGGGLGLFRGQARLAGGLRQGCLDYSAAVSHLNVVNGIDGDDAYRNTTGQGRLSYRPSATTAFSARIYAVDSFLQLNTDPEAIGSLPSKGILAAIPLSRAELRRYEAGTPLAQLNVGNATFIPSADDPDNRRKAHFFAGVVTFDQRPSKDFGYSISYHGLVSGRTFRDGPRGVSFQPDGNTQSDFDGRIHTVNGHLNLQLGRFGLIDGGYEFESENYVNRSFPAKATENSSVDITERSQSLFVQDQVRLFDDRLQFLAAFRTQYFSLKSPRFAPAESAPYQGLTFRAPSSAYTGDGSIAYFFREAGTKIRAHAGNGYRAPSLYERFGTFFSSFGYSVFGDPRLRPERSIAIDVGLDQKFLNNRVQASATYFYTRLQEVIVFDFSGAINPETDAFGRFGGYRNTNGGLARGVELSATSTPTPSLDLSLAYTYTNSIQRRPLIEDVLRSFIIPKHQFSLTAAQRFGRRLLVNLDLTASGEYLAPIFNSQTFASRAYRFDGIVKTDVVLSYRLPVSDFKAVRFYGKVENLFDRTYYESGYRTPGVTGIGGVRFEF